jgi:hypothetical protein
MLQVVRELWTFMHERQKPWLAPVAALLFGAGAVLAVAQGSVLAPFIYSIS